MVSKEELTSVQYNLFLCCRQCFVFFKSEKVDWHSLTPLSFLEGFPCTLLVGSSRLPPRAVALSILFILTSPMALTVQQGPWPYLSDGRNWCAHVIRLLSILSSLQLFTRKTSFRCFSFFKKILIAFIFLQNLFLGCNSSFSWNIFFLLYNLLSSFRADLLFFSKDHLSVTRRAHVWLGPTVSSASSAPHLGGFVHWTCSFFRRSTSGP